MESLLTEGLPVTSPLDPHGNRAILEQVLLTSGDIPLVDGAQDAKLHPGQFVRYVGSEHNEDIVMVASAKPPLHVSDPTTLPQEAIHYPGDIILAPGFDLEATLSEDKLGGRIVEVAGPTTEGYGIINALGTWPENTLVSNIPIPSEVPQDVDFFADATQLPFQDNSLGACITSAIGDIRRDPIDETRKKVLHEFNRVLRPGGLVVFQGAFWDDIQYAIAQCGFVPQALQMTHFVAVDANKPSGSSIIVFSAVFQKPLPAEGVVEN